MTDYYVDGAVGNDGNAGTSEGSGNAWATLTHAETVAGSGDRVYVKASATYTETLTFSKTYNFFAPNCKWIGYTTTPGDGGQATIDGESTRAYGITDNFSNRFLHEIHNFRCTNHTQQGIHNSTGDSWIIFNVTCDNNGHTGLSSEPDTLVVNAYCYDNTTNNFNCGGSSLFNFHGHGSGQVNLQTGARTLLHGLFHSPGATTDGAIVSGSFINTGVIYDHTSYGGSADSVQDTVDQEPRLSLNNIILGGVYGWDQSFGTDRHEYWIDNSLFNGYGTDSTDGTVELLGNVIDGSDPLLDANYELQSGSPCFASGMQPRTS